MQGMTDIKNKPLLIYPKMVRYSMLRSFCMSVKQQLDKKCLLSNPVVAYQCVTESQLPPNDVSYCAMPLFMEKLCGNVLYVYEHVWHM